jgi:hypothetical protein
MFPEKTKYLKRPIGWKDLGEIKPKNYRKDGVNMVNNKICPDCRRTQRVFRNNGENKVRRHCRNCMLEIK